MSKVLSSTGAFVEAGAGGIAQYDSDATWSKDDLVVYNNSIYAANNDKSNSYNRFVEGGDSDEWRPVGNAGLISEYDKVILNAAGGFQQLTTTWTDALTFTLPSSGVWEITIDAGIYNVSGTSSIENIRLVDANDNVVDGVEFAVGGTGDTFDYLDQGSLTLQYESAGPETLRIQGHGSARLFNGRTRVSWTKLAGFIPALGYESSCVSIKQTADCPIPSAGNPVINLAIDNIIGASPVTISNGIMTFNRKGSFKVQAGLLPTLSSAGFMSFQLYKNGVSVGTQGLSTTSTSTGSYGDQPTASYMGDFDEGDTLEIRTSSTSGNINYEYTFVNIEQLAKQAPYTTPDALKANYLFARATAQQEVTEAVSNVICSTVDESLNVDYNTTTGVVTLKAGITYELSGSLGALNETGNNSRAAAQFYDVTNSVWFGEVGTTAAATDGAILGLSYRAATAVITPTTDINVALRVRGSVLTTTTVGYDINANGDGGYPYISVKSIGNQQPVTTTTTTNEISDITSNAASGYVDIGNTRIQWGTNTDGTNTGNVVFPQPFANTSYAVTFTIHQDTNSQIYQVQLNNKGSASQVGYRKVYSNASVVQGAVGETFDWIAIGTKP